MKRVSDEDEPVWRGEGREWRSGAFPGKAGMAPTASLNGMRRSEKAEVLEKA